MSYAKVVNQTNTAFTMPRWLGDWTDRRSVWAGGAHVLASDWRVEDAVVVDVGAAGAAQGATSVPVVALSGPIPSGTVLDFGTNKFARLTAAAAAGATSLTVTALVTALVDADVATYAGSGTKKKYIPAGTLVGRTRAERASNQGFGPWTTGDEEEFLTLTDVIDADDYNGVMLCRPGSQVYENLLPNWSTLAAGAIARIRALYHCMVLPV